MCSSDLVAKAVATGDVKSLAIIGGRVGGETLLKGLGKLGKRAAGKVAAKSLKFLGEAAGPIGDAVDIGLNIWSITSSVNILRNSSSTKYEQNDAIADIGTRVWTLLRR